MAPSNHGARNSTGRSSGASGRSKASTAKTDAGRRGLRLKRGPTAARKARGTGLRFGTHAVAEALRAGRATAVLLQRDLGDRQRLASIAALAHEAGVPVRRIGAEELDALAGAGRHQGVAAEVAAFRYRALDDVLSAPRSGDVFLLALDGVEDPHNLGAILRSADAAGVEGVIVPERRSAPVTPTVARASAGAVDHVAVAQVVNLPRTLQALKARGIWVYGLDVDGTVAYDEADYDRPVAIVAGAEGSGLGRLVRETCDLLLRIPLYGHVESLNVSVATALALFAARRARDRADGGWRMADGGS